MHRAHRPREIHVHGTPTVLCREFRGRASHEQSMPRVQQEFATC